MPGPIGPRLLIMVETVQPLSRATNAAAADAVGIQKSNMSHIQNTESKLIAELHERWAIAHGYRQASNKLDKSSGLGYHRSQGQARDGQAIDICGGPLMGPRNSAAEILQQRGRYARHEKSPARARNGSCRVMVRGSRNSVNQQASRRSSTVDQRARSTDKQAKPSSNRQASMDPGTSFKHP